jgi:glyceraldehyde 3-phosphate dehydrogenase
MPIKVGINGYGRIGRNILRALYEAKRTAQIQIVAVNDLGDAQTNAHLTRYDTVHGRFPGEVQVDGNAMVVNGDRIRVLAERDPSKLPWGELGAEFILECTGLFSSRAKASAHLKGGAKKVVISAPGGEDVDATIVYGVNDALLKSSYTVISNASCTTNCLAPVAKVLHDNIGIVAGTDQDRRRRRRRARHARAQGQTRRLFHPRADHQRLAGGPDFHGATRHERAGSQ